MEVQPGDQLDELNLGLPMRDHPIMLEWSTDAEGEPILVIAEGSTFPAPRAGPLRASVAHSSQQRGSHLPRAQSR